MWIQNTSTEIIQVRYRTHVIHLSYTDRKIWFWSLRSIQKESLHELLHGSWETFEKIELVVRQDCTNNLNLRRGGSRGRVQGCAPLPPPLRWPAAFQCNWYSAKNKWFRPVTSQSRHSLVVHPLLRKILDPPLLRSAVPQSFAAGKT